MRRMFGRLSPLPECNRSVEADRVSRDSESTASGSHELFMRDVKVARGERPSCEEMSPMHPFASSSSESTQRSSAELRRSHERPPRDSAELRRSQERPPRGSADMRRSSLGSLADSSDLRRSHDEPRDSTDKPRSDDGTHRDSAEMRRKNDGALPPGGRPPRGGSHPSPFAAACAQAIQTLSTDTAGAHDLPHLLAATPTSSTTLGDLPSDNLGERSSQSHDQGPANHMSQLNPEQQAVIAERRRSLGMARARSVPLRISIDLPQDRALDPNQENRVAGRIVRRRVRVPVKVAITFGLISTAALLVGLTTLSIGVYNLSRLRLNRAQKSIQNLEDDLRPVFQGMSASLAGVQAGLNTLLGRPGGPAPAPLPQLGAGR